MRNFTDALRTAYQNRNSDKDFSDPFWLYCQMSSLCNETIDDKKNVLLFYQLNEKVNIVQAVLDGEWDVYERYSAVSYLLGENLFRQFVESIKEVLVETSNEEPPFECQEEQVKDYAKTSEQEQTVVPVSTTDNGKTIITLSVIGGILLTLGIIVTIGCVLNWSWTAWQWFIGCVGGLGLTTFLCGITMWLDDECVIDFDAFGTILLGVFNVINIILLVTLRANYKIIFGCLSVYSFIIGVILIIQTFDDTAPEGAIVQIVETLINVVFFVLSLTVFNI